MFEVFLQVSDAASSQTAVQPQTIIFFCSLICLKISDWHIRTESTHSASNRYCKEQMCKKETLVLPQSAGNTVGFLPPQRCRHFENHLEEIQMVAHDVQWNNCQ